MNLTKYEDVSKILESIAQSFAKDSVQYKALDEAAWAFLFVNMRRDLKEAFDIFRMHSGKELSEAQKQHLRQMGIEPYN